MEHRAAMPTLRNVATGYGRFQAIFEVALEAMTYPDLVRVDVANDYRP
jgi:hypothetical protein